MQVGSGLEVLLLAFGLADQMNTLKSDKLKAEKQARMAQHDMVNKLAVEVSQRTAELEQANHRLNELATVDELTGALNRRRFNQLFSAELTSRQQQAQPFAFCMIDIDGFKRYNDECGHQAGDQVLQQLSRCLQNQLKGGQGQLFRLGGEEFGVLFSSEIAAAELQDVAETLRQAIEELAIAHPGGGVVTASFGLLTLAPGSPVSESHDVYLRADELLYKAKANGRNCIVHAVL
ncbi:MAG: GGDEF domain-containing protein [Oceanococcus sp.]